jgi:ribosome-associated translation inhibitor RaiA
MQILTNSDHTITGSESISERVESIVTDAVSRFADRITRVEVHLNDVNADKRGDRDKRCMMEARLGGLAPIAVTHQAATLLEAIEGAADKLERALEHALGRLEDAAGPAPREEEIASPELLQEVERLEARDRKPGH